MDKIIHDANSEIVSLREKLSCKLPSADSYLGLDHMKLANRKIAVQLEQKNLEQRNEDLVQAFREKSRSQQRAQRLYQTLKTQVLASQVQVAASDDAEQTLHYATGNRTYDRSEPSGPASFGHKSGRYSSDRNWLDHKAYQPLDRIRGSRSYESVWDAQSRVPEPISMLSTIFI